MIVFRDFFFLKIYNLNPETFYWISGFKGALCRFEEEILIRR